MDGGKEQAGEEGEVIDEEAEFGLVLLPMGWPVESKGKEDHVDARQQAGLGEEGPGYESERQGDLEEGRHPGKECRHRKTGSGDVTRRRADIGEFEAGGHAGIVVIHQELQLVPELTVAENLWLGRFPAKGGVIHSTRLIETVRTKLEEIGIDVDPSAKVASLSIGARQMVEIAKAVMLSPSSRTHFPIRWQNTRCWE